MQMKFFPVTTFLFQIFFSQKSSNVRLEKKGEKSHFEQFCDKIAPYVLFFALVLLGILILIILVKYGASITGTESNTYYYHLEGRWKFCYT